jgi:hypothetical protein
MNRVVQKLQFLNNNRLKKAKNVNFVRNLRFLQDLAAKVRWTLACGNQPGC